MSSTKALEEKIKLFFFAFPLTTSEGTHKKQKSRDCMPNPLNIRHTSRTYTLKRQTCQPITVIKLVNKWTQVFIYDPHHQRRRRRRWVATTATTTTTVRWDCCHQAHDMVIKASVYTPLLLQLSRRNDKLGNDKDDESKGKYHCAFADTWRHDITHFVLGRRTLHTSAHRIR